MLMEHALIYAISLVILGVLVINKDITLQILNNITFKWIFEKKFNDEVKKTETNVTIKDAKGINAPQHLSRTIGVGLVLLGSTCLLIVGISWMFAPFQYVKEVGSKVYMDSPSVARNLIVLESILTGIFTIVMTIIGLKWSNAAYERKVLVKYLAKNNK